MSRRPSLILRRTHNTGLSTVFALWYMELESFDRSIGDRNN
jgi:hypothetical protein